MAMHTQVAPLIAPYGGSLVDLLVPAEARAEVKARASQLPSIQLSERSVCDLELLATGAFSPLDRFMGQTDYQRVLEEMRLHTGQLFPLPITLPVETSPALHLDRDIALRDSKNDLLAVMTLEEIYPWELADVAHHAFGTRDVRHPLVAEMHRWGPLHMAGRLQVVQLPKHYDFQELRLTPAQTRARLEAFGYAGNIADVERCD